MITLKMIYELENLENIQVISKLFLNSSNRIWNEDPNINL